METKETTENAVGAIAVHSGTYSGGESELRTFMKYLLPSMLGMALVAVYIFTDTFVVGRNLGAVALGAMGICTPIITTALALGFMFGIGGGSLYSISRGRKAEGEANSYFSTAAISALILGTFLALLGNLFIDPLARFLGADDSNLHYVFPYLRCVLFYIPGFITDQMLSCFVRNDGHPKVAMTAVAVGTLLNVVLDFLFVYGFEWGMFGAAFATCFCSFVAICINLSYTFWKRLNIRVQLHRFDLKKSWQIMKSGFSVFVFESSSGIVTFVFILQSTMLYGTPGASIYTIIMNWSLITVNMALGVTQAAQPLISLSYGAQEYDKMYTYRRYSVTTALLLGVGYLLVGYGFTDSLVSVFATDSAQLITDTVFALRLYLPAYLIMAVGICIGIYYQSIQESAKSLTLMTLRGVALPVVAAVGFSFLWGKTGLWLAIPFSELATALLAAFFLWRDKHAVVHAAPVVVEHIPSPKPFVITISRQYGSGGSVIGARLAQRLSIPVYDKEVSALTAQRSGYDADIVSMEENSAPVPYGLFVNGHYEPISHQIFNAQSRALESLAHRGPCVIIGRCAEHVLQHKARLVNAFVYADAATRAARLEEQEHLTHEAALQKMSDYDCARSEYHDYFTHREWGKKENYDLVLNSALGIDACVEALLAFVQQVEGSPFAKR